MKAYAHDRIVCTSYIRPPKGLIVGRMSACRRRKAQKRSNLVKRHELRRGLKIGGRVRTLPNAKRFTVLGRNMLRDGAHIVEHYNQGLCLFVTLTIAASTEEAFKTVGIASGYIADRMNRWLRYKVAAGNYVYCWEVQRRGAPHMHYLFRIAGDTDLVAFKLALRQEWRQILLDVSAQTLVDLFDRGDGTTWRFDPNKPRVNFVHVSRRYANYISKYTSKTRTKDGSATVFRPSTWWGVSQPLRTEIQRVRVDTVLRLPSLRVAEKIQDLLCSLSGPVNQMWKRFSPVERSDMQTLSFFCAPKIARDVANCLISFAEDLSWELLNKRLMDLNTC